MQSSNTLVAPDKKEEERKKPKKRPRKPMKKPKKDELSDVNIEKMIIRAATLMS